MYRFWHSIIEPLCKAADVRTIVEIGVGEGDMTRLLIPYAKEGRGHIHAIDPIVGKNSEALKAEAGSLLTVHNCTSLEILSTLAADAVLIDGDHNWYTVLHELQAIADWNNDPLIFFHDTGWPYGRRDMYYNATRIPQESRHASATLGIDPSSTDLIATGGLNRTLENARSEGGPRNGVLTAIEDFLKAHGDRWHWQHLPGIHGLGILTPKNRLIEKPHLAELLKQLHIHPLLQKHIEATEQDRLCHLVRTKDLEQELQTATKNMKRMLEHHRKQIAAINRDSNMLEQNMKRMQHTRSWRCTEWLRKIDTKLHDVLRTIRRVFRLKRFHVLVIDEKFPTPDRDSGSLRMIRLLRILRNMRCDITFLPSLETGKDNAVLRNAGIRTSGDSVESHLIKNGRRYDIILLSRAPVAARHFASVRRHAPHARIIFDTVDLHGVRLKRQADITGNPEHARDAEHCRTQEEWLIKNADCTVVVSDDERQHICKTMTETAVFTISNIHDSRPSTRSFEERRDILFIGNFVHAPNIDAMQYFVKEIFPYIEKTLPNARLHILGTSSELMEISSDRIILHGHVPDITAHLENVRLTIAPLRFGAGVKGKIHSSLICGTPVVTTSIGAEGMFLEHEKNCLIADDPRTFATNVERLYKDRNLWERLVAEGYRTMDAHFSTDVARKHCIAMLRYLDTTPAKNSSAL